MDAVDLGHDPAVAAAHELLTEDSGLDLVHLEAIDVVQTAVDPETKLIVTGRVALGDHPSV